MPHMTGLDLLARTRALHPSARRLALIGVWDRSANEQMSQAMTLGWLDGWVLKPWEPAEEHLYLPVSEQLTEWIRATGQPGFVAIRIVGEQWARRSHEIRDLLDRNAISYRFYPPDSEAGRQLLRESGQDGTRLPVAVLFDGRVLVDPTDAEGATAIGVGTRPRPGRHHLGLVRARPARRAGGPHRCLRGAAHADGGAGGAGRAGRQQLADPQLPRLPVRGQRPQPRPSGFCSSDLVRRGVGLCPRGRAAASRAGLGGHLGQRQP